MSSDRLVKQIAFIKEIDKAKSIFRRNCLLDGSRYENDAEHSWHLAIMAILLSEHANDTGLDIGRVVTMVLIHDLVEIGVGDTFIYDLAGQATKAARERESAERIFGMLPDDQRDQFRALWDEFEAMETSEAKFAGALDRLQPLIHNASTEGHSWKKHGVKRHQVEAVNGRIAEGSDTLWTLAKGLIARAALSGHLDE